MNIGDAVRQADEIYISFCPAETPPLSIKVTKAALKECVGDLRHLNNPGLCSWSYENGRLFIVFAT